MTTITVSFLGEENSGKSRLINRFMTNEFSEGPRDITGVFYQTRRRGTTKLRIWDIEGDKIPSLAKHYLKDCNASVYTVDCSEVLDEVQFAANLRLIKEASPNAPIILVGCKNDLRSKITPAELLALQHKYQLTKSFTTSALSGEGIDELFSFVANLGSAHKIQATVTSEPTWNKFTLEEMKALLDKRSPLYQAIENLESLTYELPEDYRKKITSAIADLISGLINPHKQDKEVVIEKFVQDCNKTLAEASKLGLNKETIARVSKGVLILATASLIAMAITSLTLGIGPLTLVTAAVVGAGIAGSILLAQRGIFKYSFNSALNKMNSAAEAQLQREEFSDIGIQAQA